VPGPGFEPRRGCRQGILRAWRLRTWRLSKRGTHAKPRQPAEAWGLWCKRWCNPLGRRDGGSSRNSTWSAQTWSRRLLTSSQTYRGFASGYMASSFRFTKTEDGAVFILQRTGRKGRKRKRKVRVGTSAPEQARDPNHKVMYKLRNEVTVRPRLGFEETCREVVRTEADPPVCEGVRQRHPDGEIRPALKPQNSSSGVIWKPKIVL
jgi:hypothetical protein